MKAHLNLEDVEGRVAVQVIWPEDFNKDSHAHQIALLAIKYIETLLEPVVEPVIVTNENAEDLHKLCQPPDREVLTPGSKLTQ